MISNKKGMNISIHRNTQNNLNGKQNIISTIYTFFWQFTMKYCESKETIVFVFCNRVFAINDFVNSNISREAGIFF